VRQVDPRNATRTAQKNLAETPKIFSRRAARMLPDGPGILAPARREPLKNKGFLAFGDSLGACDDLLTSGVDKPDRGGL
jgi:hypothetical protein